MLSTHQDLLFLIVNDDELDATWNLLTQEFEGSMAMGIIDGRQSPDLVEYLQIPSFPQLLYVEQDSYIYYDGQMNVESIKEWLSDHEHSEEETVIVIEVEQPRVEEQIQWITDVEEDHHHNDEWEKKQYDELQQLQILNDQLQTKTTKFQRELEQINLSLGILQTQLAIETHRSEQSVDFSIYLYSSLMIAIVCSVISACQIRKSKKQSILIQ